MASNDPEEGEVSVRLNGVGDREIPFEFKITADDAAAADEFGYSVSISSNYAIVGAWHNDDNGANSGSAYIFVRNGDEWIEQAKLTANDAAADDWFGCSVSINGDYAIVGAFGNDDNGNSSGSAYLFARDDDGWIQRIKLTSSDAAAEDYFGCSVSINGDYAIVGAWGNQDRGFGSGSAYIFVRNGDEWVEREKLTAYDADADDRFGASVSIEGDHVIVGRRWDDAVGYNSGSAYIFVRNGDRWTLQTKVTSNDAAPIDQFGGCVSIDGDYAIVGATGDDGADGGDYTGSAYIFGRDGDRWTQRAKLTADDAAAADGFGGSVSINGDYAIVAAGGNDDHGESSGSAYIFGRDGNDWHQQTKLTAEDAEAGDRFGQFISLVSYP